MLLVYVYVFERMNVAGKRGRMLPPVDHANIVQDHDQVSPLIWMNALYIQSLFIVSQTYG